MLFMGQEYAAAKPFLYFADNRPELAAAVLKGRADFLSQFPSLASPGIQDSLANPSDRSTFERCRLDPAERNADNPVFRLHRDLLRLRREYPFNAQQHRGVDGAVLAAEAFVLRVLTGSVADRLLVINLGCDLMLVPAPEPLLAAPKDHQWVTHWSSENPAYEGGGMTPVDQDDGWHIPGHAAVVLRHEAS
jgi:maltooligosyltrehalose trehalohydrolase